MCGIFAYAGKKRDVGLTVLTGLKLLEYRGYDSWGVAIKKNKGKILLKKKVGKIGNATLQKVYGSIGIGHTRWATHGGVTTANSHPHTDCGQNVILVHNGIVENCHELIRSLRKPHVFSSKTDSEVIAHLIEEELVRSKNTKQAVQSSFQKLKGLNAFIVFFPKSNELYALKNSSPLILGVDRKNDSWYLSSDLNAFPPMLKQAYFLDDDVLLKLTPNSFSIVSKQGKRLSIKLVDINLYRHAHNLGRYAYAMEKEIHEQPTIIRNLINSRHDEVKKIAQAIDNAFGTYLIGSGTAYYASLAGSYLFSKVARKHINSCVGSEFSYLVDFLKKNSLVIPLSQSGETIDIISSIKSVQQKGSRVYAITNMFGSTLYRMADAKFLLHAGPEKAVLATKSFTAKLATLFLAAYTLKNDLSRGINFLKKSLTETQKILKSRQLQPIAAKLATKKHVYVLGRGLLYPIALEWALKLKEGSYIHAEGFAGGELKHGVIALVEKNTPVIALNPEDETYQDTLSSAYEVKARGAQVIGVSSKKNSIFDEFIRIEDCQESSIIPYTVTGQLIAFYCAIKKGINPDKPRNLAKSVTVK